jgi:hypothetical protein
MRQVRRVESGRDDPLIDDALDRLARSLLPSHAQLLPEVPMQNTAQSAAPADDPTVTREARRILRRLSEPGAFLAVAPGMDKAVVLRDGPGDETTRTAVLDRTVAEAFALRDWIARDRTGKVSTYRITGAGRGALKRLLAEERERRRPPGGFAESPSPFAEQHRSWGHRTVMDPDTERPRRLRYNMAESPLTVLARRKDKEGQAFLSPELVQAGERLREDFELAHMGPRVAQNWDRFLTAGVEGGGPDDRSPGDGASAARDRVRAALADLGPGLGDIALRCCCHLEGLETAEKRMGWSARSGKIVLRIALQRLRRHYEERHGRFGPMIG